MSSTGITAAWRSEKGRRPTNEDACLVLTRDGCEGLAGGLLIVADGMGGRASGEAASRIAVETIRDEFISAAREDRDSQDIASVLSRGFQAANTAVYSRAHSKPELEGMGTTCVAAAVVGDEAFVAHMGDSRAYLLHEGRLRRLTEDHSYVAERVRAGELTEGEAQRSRFRNVVTKALGVKPDAEPEIGGVALVPGDVLLLCTDGLTTAVPESRIEDVLRRSSSPREACGALVEASLRSGGSDNVTVVVAAVEGGSRSPIPARRRITWLLPSLVALAVGTVLGLYSGGLPLFEKSAAPAKQTAPIREANLRNVAYEHPVSLLYVPLQGRALALDRRGYIHVVDRQGRLLRIDRSGRVVYKFPRRKALKSRGAVSGAMVASDGQGNLYVSEAAGGRIVKYGSDGLFVGSIGDGKLVCPEALAVDRDGSIYIIDGGRLKAIKPKQDGPPAGSTRP